MHVYGYLLRIAVGRCPFICIWMSTGCWTFFYYLLLPIYLALPYSFVSSSSSAYSLSCIFLIEIEWNTSRWREIDIYIITGAMCAVVHLLIDRKYFPRRQVFYLPLATDRSLAHIFCSSMLQRIIYVAQLYRESPLSLHYHLNVFCLYYTCSCPVLFNVFLKSCFLFLKFYLTSN